MGTYVSPIAGYVTNMVKNVANEYAFMLLSQVLTELLARKEDSGPLDSLTEFKVPVVIIQVLTELLRTQGSDGSWSKGSHEITAYCVLSLVSLSAITFPTALNNNITAAIEAGRAYLRLAQGVWRSEPIWIEKVRYYSPLLTETYCTCALLAPVPVPSPHTCATPRSSSLKMMCLFNRLPLFRSLPNPQLSLKLALAESQVFLSYLHSTRLAIFPRSKDLKKEKYMEIIPFAWTACNALRDTPLPAEILMEMMSISLLNFQADKFFELITSKTNARALSWLVEEACRIITVPQQDDSDRGARAANALTPPDEKSLLSDLDEVTSVVQRFANRILQHPAVTSAPQRIQLDVQNKLARYLRAQIISATCRSLDPDARTNRKSLFGWVRKLGAEDTSCPYSFAFYMALSKWTFQEEWRNDPSREYVLEALCGHLSTLCRMYNDYGSLTRDREEGNLSCADFLLKGSDSVVPYNKTGTDIKRARGLDRHGEKEASAKPQRINTENRTATNKIDTEVSLGDELIKEKLMGLADFERQCMELALVRLKNTGLKGKMLEALLLFVDVTDMFGQIYVVKDIGTRTV
jgi:hypothetical protein